uniref:Uncharacterized protein n=1 Tax=Ditylenchus dipsaci TaxID=166011 RepID=A0A915E304_9BILA
MERLEYIGAFAAAALSLIRVSKPFNPMLRETYELEREDLGFRFVAEQVSENPPTSAFHCTGAGYDFHGQISPFVKMSMTAKITVDPKASFTLRLIGHKEEYKWQSINVIVHNCVRAIFFMLLMLKYRDAKTSGAEYMITGQVVDGSKAVCRIYGNWSSYLATCPPASFSDCVFEQRFRSHCDGAFPSSRVLYTDSKKLWIHYKRPNNASQYYGFTFFAMSANHLISPRSALLPRTDTRLRPDVRLMENGKFEQSLTETKRLQARTKGNEITVVSNNPKWFTEYQETGSSTIFKYNGLYWKRSFEGCADIFGLP